MIQAAEQVPAELEGVEGNERLKAIYARIVEKMKEVVREFEIDQDELHIAGDYLNRLGQSGFCRSLVDVSLAMTSVDVTARVEGATRPNLEGPFHKMDAPVRDDGCLFDVPSPSGAPVLVLSGQVRDVATGLPIPGATVDLWQADHEGHYDRAEHHLSGRVIADAYGRYTATTAVPKDYSDHDTDPIGELFRAMGRHNRRAGHVHAKIWIDGRCVLTTQLFVPGNPYLSSDYVEGAVSPDLILDMRTTAEPERFAAIFDFVVQRPNA
ncbi:dioxygenase [Sphingomonas profundi]|uniref:dioxygenase family protein n=1 Tax=Alterirhizorhabdus profundi TaxID=2681549 RepID=UPI0012E7C560|nr:dioxygenase [Sphingomonas profundi]